jgi:predicted 2-oxoglutarate/Fe(II)-dependent dioxygenase YbiX
MVTQFIEDFLTEKECKEIILFGESLKLQESQTYTKNGSQKNQDINKRHLAFIGSEKFSDLNKKVLDCLNSHNFYKNSEYTKIEYFVFNKYVCGDFLKYHFDGHAIENLGATLTLIFQLNNDYEGGDILYKVSDNEYTLPKKTGSVFVFDSNLEHEISEVKNGIRYSLNCWPFLESKNKSLF